MEVLFEIDGKIYELNPAIDLMNVKFGFRTKGFAKRMFYTRAEEFSEYSHLEDDEIRALDDSLGYTFGLNNDSYKNDSLRDEKDNTKIYMEDAVQDICQALHDKENFEEYLNLLYPGINVNSLAVQEQDKYRIEFIRQYVNNFASDYPYIERRDLFERLVMDTSGVSEEDIHVFNGIDSDNKMMTILKYVRKYSR